MSPKTLLRRLSGHADGEYVGRHRADATPEEHELDVDWSPLAAATRQHLAPTHYADRQLPAGPEELTAHFDPAAVLAASTTQGEPATRSEVMAEIRADLDDATQVIPAATGATDPALTDVTRIFTDAMTREQQ